MILGIIYSAVCNQFGSIEGDSFGTDVSGVDDVISPDSDLCAVFVLLVGFDFTYNLGVGELFAAVGGDIPEPYNVEGVVAFYTL